MSTPLQEKRAYRREVRERLRGCDAGRLHRWSLEIQRRVLRLRVYQEAAGVAAYMALPDEVSTALILADCTQRGRPLWLPAATEHGYRFLPWAAGQPLVEGPRGILQPPAETPDTQESPALILVPGLAFDLQGHRIGHGAGIYDRLLAAEHGYRLGIAFSLQLFAAVPSGAHDAHLHGILTERETACGEQTQTLSEKQQPE